MIKAIAEQGTAPAPGGRKPMSPSDRARHASLVRWGKEQPFAARLAAIRERRKKAKGGSAKKPKAPPKPTAEQRKEQNLNNVRQFMMDNDQGLAPAGFDNLIGLGKGTEPDKVGSDGLIKMGLAERGSDGTLRLTPAGRAAISAANRGDAKGAIDAISRGVEKAEGKEGAPKLDKDGKPSEEKPAAGGGGGGGSKKPTKEEKDQERQKERAKTAAETAKEVGLAAADVNALRGAAEGTQAGSFGPASGSPLQKLGLIGTDGQATDQGRRALGALERGDVRQYRAAIQDAQARLGREKAKADRETARESERTAREAERTEATAAREQERTARNAERERVRTARKERVQNVALRRLDRTGKLSDRQAADLEEAGLVEFDDKGAPRLTEAGRARLRKPPEEKKALDYIKHGSHDQSSHGRSGRRGGGGRSSTGGDTTLRSAGLITDKKMTQDERTSLQWYQGVGHDRVNAELRGSAPIRDQYTLDRTTGNIDSIMARSKLNQDVEVHRGMYLDTPHAQTQIAQWQPGAIVRDLGYVSTSANQDVAQRFGDDVTVRIRAPKGTPAIYMPTAQPLRMTSQGAHNEYEVLLGRGLNYRVTGREEKDGKLTVDMEVVP